MGKIIQMGCKVSQSEWERIFGKSEEDRQKEFKAGVEATRKKGKPKAEQSCKNIRKGFNMALGGYYECKSAERECLKKLNGDTGAKWECTG